MLRLLIFTLFEIVISLHLYSAVTSGTIAPNIVNEFYKSQRHAVIILFCLRLHTGNSSLHEASKCLAVLALILHCCLKTILLNPTFVFRAQSIQRGNVIFINEGFISQAKYTSAFVG